MRLYGFCAWAVVLSASIAFATPATTQPAPTGNTTPTGKVVIFPFEVLGDAGSRAWVSRALQQSIATEVARANGLSPIAAPPLVGSLDTTTERNAAKALGGDLVIVGAYQFAGNDVRFTGQVLNVNTGKALGGLKASGEFSDLFEMEDELSIQVRRALREELALAPATTQPAVDHNMVFGPPPADLSPRDLFPVPSDVQQYGDQYNRYYLDETNYYGGYGGAFGDYYYSDIGFYPGIGYGYGYLTGGVVNRPYTIYPDGQIRQGAHDGSPVPGRIQWSPPPSTGGANGTIAPGR